MRSRTFRAAVFPWIASMLLACATGQGQGCRRDGTTTGDTTQPPTTSTTGVATNGTAGEIDDGTAADIDRELAGALADVYGQPRRAAWRREGTVYTLDYDLPRAHARADVEPLRSALVRRGFEIDRVLDDAAVSSIFAAKTGTPLSVTVDVGATRLVAAIELAGP